MKNNIFKRLMAIIIIFSIMLPFSVVYADGLQTELNSFMNVYITKQMLHEVSYTAEGTELKMVVLELPVVSSASKGKFYIETKSSAKKTLKYQYGDTLAESCIANIQVFADGQLISQGQVIQDDTYGSVYLINADQEKGLSQYDGMKLSMTISFMDASGNVLAEKTVDISATSNVKSSNADASVIDTIVGWITAPFKWFLGLLEQVVMGLLLSVGDGALHLVCSAVGEIVTIDTVIKGDVSKTSIDFWNSADSPTSGASIVSVMKDVTTKWYSVFRNIAFLVYLIILIYLGIRIMISSTGESMAKYKEVLTQWVVGIAMLVFFPYVMKYTVVINQTLVDLMFEVADQVDQMPKSTTIRKVPALDDITGSYYGDNAFISAMTGGNSTPSSSEDTMMYTRLIAARSGRIPLVFVYYVMIGQLVAILILYYKRAFMIAFLIVIYPLVAMTYTIDKLGDRKAQSFSLWFKEFWINVFVQSFHAAVYVIVTRAGIQAYETTQNWFFMMLSVLFLFKGEKILRSIFGAQSSANTIKDLATAGVAAYGMASKAKDVLKRDKKDKEQKEKEEEEEKEENDKIPNAQIATTPPSLPVGDDGFGGSKAPVMNASTMTSGRNATLNFAKKRLDRKSIMNAVGKGVGSVAKVSGKAYAGMVGATVGLAQGNKDGDTVLGNAIQGAYVGTQVGKGVVNFADKSVIGKASTAVKAHNTKKEILSGKHDAELGIDAVLESETQQIYREALAKATSEAMRKGKVAGDAKFWTEMDRK